MENKKKNPEIDVKKVNDVVGLSKSILKIAYFLLLIGGIYIVTMIFKEWKIKNFVFELLTIVSPLFIGIVIAWLFDPFIKWLKRHGIKRKLGAFITYFLLIGAIVLIIGSILPLLYEQITEFAKTLPAIFETIKNWIDSIFDKVGDGGFDVTSIKTNVFATIEAFGVGLTESLPDAVIGFVKAFFSGAGVFVIGLIIGFFMLIGFESFDTVIAFIPKRFQEDTRDLLNEMNSSLRKFVQGAVLDSTLIFVVTTIGLWAVGLKAPLLFGLFCGITNIIPYAGPYIGGIPAVIVGFSQGPTVGILTLIVIVVIQFLEGNFLQPIILSKTTKLHPVTIILGLLVFGYFWGILGMIVATPLIAVSKSIFMFFDDKFDFFKLNN